MRVDPYQIALPFLDERQDSTPKKKQKDTFVQLVNRAKVRKMCSNGQPFLAALGLELIDVQEVLLYPESHWKRVVEIKENGKRRICYSPSPRLRRIQERILRHLIYLNAGWVKPLLETAYWPGCNIVKNARLHRRNRSSLVVDIRNAFESVTANHILRYLNETRKAGYPTRLASRWLVSRLLTYRGKLRQGPPVSPFVFNFLMRRFDVEITGMLGVVGHNIHKPSGRLAAGPMYTRYGDDLCFSSPEPFFPDNLRHRIFEIIRKHGLDVNEKKTREGKNGIMEFPGALVVDGRVRPTGKYIASLAKQAKENLPADVLQGHRGFVRQFRKGGRLKILRDSLDSEVSPPAPH